MVSGGLDDRSTFERVNARTGRRHCLVHHLSAENILALRECHGPGHGIQVVSSPCSFIQYILKQRWSNWNIVSENFNVFVWRGPRLCSPNNQVINTLHIKNKKAITKRTLHHCSDSTTHLVYNRDLCLTELFRVPSYASLSRNTSSWFNFQVPPLETNHDL